MQRLKGEMAERFNAAVLKTVVGYTTGGSNPSLSAKSDDNVSDFFYIEKGRVPERSNGAVSKTVVRVIAPGVRIPPLPQNARKAW